MTHRFINVEHIWRFLMINVKYILLWKVALQFKIKFLNEMISFINTNLRLLNWNAPSSLSGFNTRLNIKKSAKIRHCNRMKVPDNNVKNCMAFKWFKMSTFPIANLRKNIFTFLWVSPGTKKAKVSMKKIFLFHILPFRWLQFYLIGRFLI